MADEKAAEKKAVKEAKEIEKQRIADEKAAADEKVRIEKQRLAEEKAAEQRRIADAKMAALRGGDFSDEQLSVQVPYVEASHDDQVDAAYCFEQYEAWKKIDDDGNLLDDKKQVSNFRAWTKALDKARKEIAKAKERMQEDQAHADVLAEISEELATRELYFVSEEERYYFWQAEDEFVWRSNTQSGIRVVLSAQRDAIWKTYEHVINIDDRKKVDLTYAYGDVPSSKLNLMKTEHWVRGENVDAGNHHPIFDMVLDSISGYDTEWPEYKEQRTHIEQCIYWKMHNPADLMIPMVLINGRGNTGKSLFTSHVFKGLVGEHYCINMPKDFAVGGFNGAIEGQAMIMLEELAIVKDDDDAFKNMLGTESISLNPKYGKQKVKCPNLAFYMASSNRDDGGYKFGGDQDIDRRVSVVGTRGSNLFYVILAHLKASDPDGEYSVEDAKLYLDEHKNKLRDRSECNLWMASLNEKYKGMKRRPDAYHGSHYHHLREFQKGTYIEVFENVLLDPDFDYITVAEFYQMCVLTNEANTTTGKEVFKKMPTVRSEVLAWVGMHKLDVEMGKLWIDDPDNGLMEVECFYSAGDESRRESNGEKYIGHDYIKKMPVVKWFGNPKQPDDEAEISIL